MSTNESLHIEGLDTFQDHDLTMENDTPPDAIIVWFEVVSEYMPFLSEQEGRRVYKNFVHRKYIKELGHMQGGRRIRDNVEWDAVSSQWKVKQLAPLGKSDIKKFTREWNAFQKGNTQVVFGTPIEILFKHDPSRAEMYKRNHIDSIERLAGITEADCQRGGMGWLDDKKRAMQYMANAKDAEQGIKLNTHIQKVEAENASLRAQVEDLLNKVTSLMDAKMDEGQKAPSTKTTKKKIDKTTEEVNA